MSKMSEMRQSYSHLISTMGYTILLRSWWRHQMETFSKLLTICAGNSPVTGEFTAQRPVTRIFDVLFDLHLNKRLSKRWWAWWFETLSCPLWRHCNVVRLFRPFWCWNRQINIMAAALPEHQQPCYLICRISRSLCFTINNVNCLWHLRIEKQGKMQFFYIF